MLLTYAPQADPRFGERADPAFWHPAYETLLDTCRYAQAPLGDFITHLTYGPIITRRLETRLPRVAVSSPTLALVNQGQVGEAGVDLSTATRVPLASAWDLPRARLQPDDLVLCRSGAGSVARNRLAIFLEDQPAAVGSFVDLVRFRGLEVCYVALFLKTRFGWGQIHRLINGVATPNISFSEIRGLQVALAPEALQAECRARYHEEVLPLHRARDPQAPARHRELVGWLEAELQDD